MEGLADWIRSVVGEDANAQQALAGKSREDLMKVFFFFFFFFLLCFSEVLIKKAFRWTEELSCN